MLGWFGPIVKPFGIMLEVVWGYWGFWLPLGVRSLGLSGATWDVFGAWFRLLGPTLGVGGCSLVLWGEVIFVYTMKIWSRRPTAIDLFLLRRPPSSA